MYKILVSDKLGKAGLDVLEQAEDANYEMITGLSKEELIAIIPEYDGLIIRSGTRPDADIIGAATNLKVIGRAGIGVDNIDRQAATMNGVIVMNTPTANSVATAEQTMTLMLAVSRHTAAAHASVLAGEWTRSLFMGSELHAKTLGIIGFGNIGRLVAKRAQAFGMTVVAYDPFVPEEVAQALDVTLLDLDDLLPQSDYITLHTAVTPSTTKMINAETIAQMKDGAILVNVARGKLIDEQPLADALASGKLKAAAIDVFSAEPPTGNPLVGLPNVLHTPHLGASSIEAQKAVATQIAEQVLDALRGTDFRNALNMPFRVGDDGFNALRPYIDLGEKLGAMHAGLADGRINKIELQVAGEKVSGMVKAVASGLLMGVLRQSHDGPLNYINAPILAEEQGIITAQATDIPSLGTYANLVLCRVHWDGGQRVLGGVLFGGNEPRIVRVNEYRLDARPEGVVLMLENTDVTGVVGQIGTILAAYQINIGEWRMGRLEAGGNSISFLNVDSEPSAEVLKALEQITAVTKVKSITL